MLHPTMSGTFHADEIHRIMLYLPTRDVLTCMQVCKYWKVNLELCYNVNVVLKFSIYIYIYIYIYCIYIQSY